MDANKNLIPAVEKIDNKILSYVSAEKTFLSFEDAFNQRSFLYRSTQSMLTEFLKNNNYRVNLNWPGKECK